MTSPHECPCCSGELFACCCEPYLTGRIAAPTAQALMRSRYSAYVTGQANYIVATMRGAAAERSDDTRITEASEQINWTKLTIVDAPLAQGETAVVEFIAYYTQQGRADKLHERSQFQQIDGRWYYVDGEHQHSKLGRNDPCVCGSGKKYKRCCGG